MIFLKGTPDADQLAKVTKKFDDIVAVQPAPIGENGEANPHVTRYYHSDGRISDTFLTGPLYYLTRWNTWESLRDICSHKGNHQIIIKPEHLWKVHPQYLRWLENRQKLFPANSYVAVDSPFAGNVFYALARETTISAGLATLAVSPEAQSVSVPPRVTCDGFNDSGSVSSWTGARTATTGGPDNATNYMYMRNRRLSSSAWFITRNHMGFDTSSLTSGATISATDLVITSNATPNLLNDNTYEKLILCESTPASNTAQAAGDYDAFGATTNPTEYTDPADRVDITTGYTAGNTKTFTFNATGIAAINKTGVTNIGMRMMFDSTGVAPTSLTDLQTRSADYGSDEPLLTVTYTTGGGGGGAANNAVFAFGGM